MAVPRKILNTGSYLVQSAELQSGDHLTQKEFHEAYSAAVDGYRAELIAGMVFEPAPLSLDHSAHQGILAGILWTYTAEKRALQFLDNATVILSNEDEVQPDLTLRIRPPHGKSADVVISELNYIKGAPELVVEIAVSTRAIDLHLKKERYRKLGVLEYLVVCVKPPSEIFWFDFKQGKRLAAADDGILRSRCFPGLWIDAEALLNCDSLQMKKALSRGMRSKAHKDFVNQLAAL